MDGAAPVGGIPRRGLAAGLFGLLLVSPGDHLADVVFEMIVIDGMVAG
jgi:hypothetical protein